MGKNFYLKLALNNLKRNQKKLIPYSIAATIMISVYFMVIMIIYTPGLSNVPESGSLKMLFQIGLNVLNIFIAVFMLYINSFLVKQRKKEFGLYGVLGLEKHHVGYVMLLENLIINGAAIIAGIISGCVFGWLIFMLLLKSVNVTTNSYFAIPAQAFLYTLIYFIALFFIISLLNLLQVRMANPIDLLKSDHQGEKKSRFIIPITMIGLVLLGFAYYLALRVKNPLTALSQFFLAVVMVIFATYALFISGSVFLLKVLKKNKKFYYKPENFVSVSGMFHRMKQNAAGLASICILSTMVLVTVSTCVALYTGQEDMLKEQNKDDFEIQITKNSSNQQIGKMEKLLKKAADDYGVKIKDEYYFDNMELIMLYEDGRLIVPDKNINYFSKKFDDMLSVSVITLSDYNRICNRHVKLGKDQVIMLSNDDYADISHFSLGKGADQKTFRIASHITDTVFTNGKNRKSRKEIYLVTNNTDELRKRITQECDSSVTFIMNIRADQKKGYQYSKQIHNQCSEQTKQAQKESSFSFQSIYEARAAFYSIFGGLLFMGAFFTILFLCATVLIIYFKQISEGYEDKERFEMLQKVGMDDREVKKTINKQILMVFFLPLIGALLHLTVASHMIIKLLGVFMLYNNKLTAMCMVGSCIVFTLVYVCVYRMTAKTYCQIVKW